MNDKKKASFIGENENPAEISNEEWGKILPQDVYHIARERELKGRDQVNIINTIK